VPVPLPRPGAAAPRAIQGTLDELGTPLADVTFVVVDLETTGGAPAEGGITEIGAVKVRGGQVLGEFQTLVNPGAPIPPFVSVLTGIGNATVASAPRIEGVLPAFLEFAAGAVLVAHNAPYDVGFLKGACERTGHTWPKPAVVDTAHLARQVVRSDEAGNRRLGTLARLFNSPVTPNHRALTDARATVDVLHALLERVGNLGVHSLEELRSFSSQVPAATRRKRNLADDLPNAPGVYLFKDDRGRVLYVGTSVDIRTRVRSYFTAAEHRTRMREMVALATSVTPVVCLTALEARVRELRLIAEHNPPYNRRSRYPERVPWVKLTAETFPRLSVVRQVRPDGATYLGPFGSVRTAELAVAALHEAFRLRQCSPKLPRRPRPGASACLLADLGRCGAPCIGRQSVADYRAIADAARAAITADAGGVVAAVLARAQKLADRHEFEDAAAYRDRMVAFVRGAARVQRLAPIAAMPELIGALRGEAGGWEFVLVRYGRLAGTALCPPGRDVRPELEALRATGAVVPPPPPPLPAAHPEETEQILRWLEQPGVRLVDAEGAWSCPVSGAARYAAMLADEPARLAATVPPAELESTELDVNGPDVTELDASGPESADEQPAEHALADPALFGGPRGAGPAPSAVRWPAAAQAAALAHRHLHRPPEAPAPGSDATPTGGDEHDLPDDEVADGAPDGGVTDDRAPDGGSSAAEEPARPGPARRLPEESLLDEQPGWDPADDVDWPPDAGTFDDAVPEAG
jgi:DNA polymerase-3 subunit epsilon